MEKFSMDFLDVMSIDAIREKVNNVRAGSWHKIMILDGSPISLDDGLTLYVTETFPVRFKIKYHSMAHVVFKDMVSLAETPKEVETCRAVYNKLKHKEVVAKTAILALEKKERLVATGHPLPKAPEEVEIEDDKRKRDAVCPSIVYCKNGQMTLTCYASFKNTIKSIKKGFEYSEDGCQRRFFIKSKDNIYEVDPESDEKVKKALDIAIKTARATAGKKTGGATAVISPRVNNILHIW